MAYTHLVADIGGTNARFALLEAPGSEPVAIKALKCRDYADLGSAIDVYLSDVDVGASPRPRYAAVALATAITGDRVTLTNHSWSLYFYETPPRQWL